VLLAAMLSRHHPLLTPTPRKRLLTQPRKPMVELVRQASVAPLVMPCYPPCYALRDVHLRSQFPSAHMAQGLTTGDRNRLSRRELLTTDTDEKAMAPPARIGLIRIPHTGYRIPAAKGMSTVL